MRAALLLVALSALASPAWAQGVSARLLFDGADQGLNGGSGYKTATNDNGTLAWGEAYILMAYAAMFRATGEGRYLVKLADHALAVLDRRDAPLGRKDYAGKSRPCWQATRYSTNNQPFCWVVHTGMLTYPMADLVALVRQNPQLSGLLLPGGKSLGEASQIVLGEVEKSVVTHDFEWRSGPGVGEGHYLGDPNAGAVVNVAGKALPLNMSNAMGRTLLLLGGLTGKAVYSDRARALATYLKNRLTSSGAAYAWTYWGDPWAQGKGEDVSHAAINVDFAVECARRNLVFGAADLDRFARTLFDRVHQDAATTSDLVDGAGNTGAYTLAVPMWANLAPDHARVWAIAANLLRGIDKTTSGSVLLGLAYVARHAPAIRDHSFYVVDWADRGAYRQATAYGANLLIDPLDPQRQYALRLGYRAVVRATVQQWDGKVYHPVLRLPAVGGNGPTQVFVPYDPAIYFAYSGRRALYEFADAFQVGKGIEVWEAAPVTGPTIAPVVAPPATVGVPYALQLQGAGDAPLYFSLPGAGPGPTLDRGGRIAFTPTVGDLPQIKLQVRLRNDSGEAQAQVTIPVVAPLDGGVDGPALDLGRGPDLALAPDLAPALDLTVALDLAPGSDLAPAADLALPDLLAAVDGEERDLGAADGAPGADLGAADSAVLTDGGIEDLGADDGPAIDLPGLAADRAGEPPEVPKPVGCSCAVAAAHRGSANGPLLLGALALLVGRRRRRPADSR